MNLDRATAIPIRGNEPLVLNDMETVWSIESGAMVVFVVQLDAKGERGARRYLFSASQGDVLHGLPANAVEAHQLIAIAVEETSVTSCPLSEFWQQVRATGRDRTPSALALERLERWVDRLDAAFVDRSGKTESDESGLTLPTSDDLAAIDGFSTYLERLHTHFLDRLKQQEKAELADRLDRFQERQRLNESSQRNSIGDLVSVLKPEKAELLQEGAALLVAAGAVGRALGIEIRPASQSEDEAHMKNPLEAIARASSIRTRRVLLNDGWWEGDCGPILAYRQGGEDAVALLPKQRGGYDILDPTAQTRTTLFPSEAVELDPVAFTFYRPFPDRALDFLELLKFSLRGMEADIAVLLLMGALATLVGMVVPQATDILMDQAIPDANRSLLWQIGAVLLAASFGKAIFELAQGFAILRTQTLFNFTNQAALWDRLLKLRISFFRQYATGDLLDRATGFDQMREMLDDNVMRSLFMGIFSVMNLGLMFTYSVPLTIAAAAISAVNFIVTLSLGSITRQKMRPLQQIQGEIFGLTVQLISGVSKLKIAGAEKRGFAYWTRRYREQLRLTLSTEGAEDTVNLFNTLLPTVSYIIIFALSVNLFGTGAGSGAAATGAVAGAATGAGGAALTTGKFLAFNAAFRILMGGITSLSDTIIEVLEVFVLWERTKPILDAVPEVDLTKADPGKLQGGIKLDRVTFRYREDGPLILNEVTVEAKPGEFIALVGPSGSGKSTTIRLMLGFETPEDGTVYFDGQDMSGLDVSAIRRQLGVVLQNGNINTGSIFDNISSGALVTMDEVWEAAQMAGFAEDVEKMPMGMHTVISEGGTNLSGGQRQRLLIARSLVLKPKVLIFDEATSALDNRTQAIVSKSLDGLDVTRIVIAHRLSTIVNADRIYVIEAGLVVQAGTFEELTAQPGLFAQLMARQMA